MNNIVSKAKLLVYPSHYDSFSLVILEALAMGTPVVSYNVMGIRSVYKGFKAVSMVKEGDIESFRNEIKKMFSLSKSEYDSIINDKNLWNFLEEHSSWKKVALNELDQLKNIMESK